MSDMSSFADIEAQHAALLPARTVLSLFTAVSGGDTIVGDSCQYTQTAGPSGVVALLGLGPAASSTAVCQPTMFVHEAPADQTTATS